MAEAVKKISAEFPADDVRIYLDTLLCQDPETWGALREVGTESSEAADRD
jgi:hypothetical protein